jgi:hypothetical protein
MKILKWIALILLAIGIGFFQERLKVSINFTIEKGDRIEHFYDMSADQRIEALKQIKTNNPFDYYQSHDSINALNHLSRGQLKLAKWIVTVFFVVVFFFLNRLALKWIFDNSTLSKWLATTYVVAFCSALVIYFGGYVFGRPDLFYAVSRKMVGALQSPIPAMMNWAGWILYLRNSK